MSSTEPRVLIVCEHASARFGGEAILPWHYFRLLRQRGIDARLIAHERTRDELLKLLPAERERMYFLKDTWINILAWKLSRFIPAQVSGFTLGYLSRLSTQIAARQLARRLVVEHGMDVVHQPIPVSPREPSLLYDMNAPVIIGPMNGNMSYPPAFARKGKWRLLGHIVSAGRLASNMANRMSPGKLRAAVLLVANQRTRDALPKGVTGEVVPLVENGVDLGIWRQRAAPVASGSGTRFVFSGRLVDWKAVDLLLDALARVNPDINLDIVGDGAMRPALEEQASQLGITARVRFRGWLPQDEAARVLGEADALVLPSLYECGGAVVLEAMACGLPVIATAWGGPADYLDSSCGVLISPESREAVVAGFANAMEKLHQDPALRRAMGITGRKKIEREYDWNIKIEQILSVYRRLAS
ncbi:MAG: glycosyltransferase family 4 protein [Steroidobacteraceae bacterium]